MWFFWVKRYNIHQRLAIFMKNYKKIYFKIEIKTRFGKKVQNENNSKGSTKHIKKNTQLLALFIDFAFPFFNKQVDQGNFQQGYTGNEQQFLFQCCMLNNQSIKKKNHNK